MYQLQRDKVDETSNEDLGKRLRQDVDICEQQYGFMPRTSTRDAIFSLRMLMERYREGPKFLYCVIVDLENAYDRMPREILWFCMRKSGVAEKYGRLVQEIGRIFIGTIHELSS